MNLQFRLHLRYWKFASQRSHAALLLICGLLWANASFAVPQYIAWGNSPATAQPVDPGYPAPFTTGFDETYTPDDSVSGVWTLSNSPYLITGNVIVPENATLTIEPGVEVIFQGNYQFIVEGRLNAIGTESDSILFTAAGDSTWGGLRLVSAHVASSLQYCRFEKGWAKGAWPNTCGGAIYMYGTIQSVKHCSFINNKANYDGGAVFMWGATPVFSYNLFTQNSAQNGNGHAIYQGNCTGLTLNHLTITGNGVTGGYSLYCATGYTLRMQNSILWDTYRFAYTPGEIDYTDIQGAPTDTLNALGDYNFNSNPRFVDASNLNLHLLYYSPCVDAASPGAPYSAEPQPNGGRANLGAYGNSGSATYSLPLLSLSADSLNTDTDSLIFGLQKINTTGTKTLTLYDVGPQIVQITALQFSNNQFTSNFEAIKDTTANAVLVYPDSSTILEIYFTPIAIDSVSGTLSLVDNDTVSNFMFALTGVGVNPEIWISQTNFEFGVAAVEDTLELPILIANVGQDTLGIESKLIINSVPATDDFRMVDFNRSTISNQTISVGDTVQNWVQFFPHAQFDFIDSLLINNNAGNVYIHMTGSGSQPQLHFNPDTLEYGVLALNESDTLEFEIWNSGDVNLILGEYTLFNGTGFTFIDSAQTIVTPSDTLTYRVVFSPVSTGSYHGILHIETNMPDDDEVLVHLFGTGTSQTNWVIGNVSGVWYADSVNYFVVGDITIPANSALTIEKGVHVLYEGNFGLTVYGTLTAVGDSAVPVHFTTISEDSTWQGITFKAGSSSSYMHGCDLYRGSNVNGGVMRIEDVSPTIDSCRFVDNVGTKGGALALLNWSTANISRCKFAYNSATSGGAIYVDWFADPQISFCEIDSNTATNGGAIYLSGANGAVYNCEIYKNSATQQGGGIFITDGSITECYQNYIRDNSAASGGGVAIRWYSKPYLHGELIYDNAASVKGGGILIQDGCMPVILKTLIVENTAPQSQALFSQASGAVLNYCALVSPAGSDSSNGWLVTTTQGDQSVISNSILWADLWNNLAITPILQQGSNLTITYSDVIYDGLCPGLNNISEDPLFTGTGSISQKYTLSGSSSPCWTHSESGGKIGYEGGSLLTDWDITLALLQNPVQLNCLNFVLTSTVPLMSPPYMYMTQDLPDTLLYTPVDSAFMIQIAPMIYELTITQSQIDYPTIMTFTLTNFFGADTTLTQQFVARILSTSGSLISLGGITISAVPENGAGVWALLPDLYGASKPLSAGLAPLGDVYQVYVSGTDIATGRIEFALDDEILAGKTPTSCGIAIWQDNAWKILDAFLSADQSAIWAALEDDGYYRLIWGDELQTVILPTEITLSQNYPNPFNPETVIEFALPENGLVKIEVFDLLGRNVATLLHTELQAGFHRIDWSGENAFGIPVASGVYFYRLQVGSKQIAKKMILLR
ncbi:MAG: right-handed parallel beta-helix repeat-containing protein [bacterium]